MKNILNEKYKQLKLQNGHKYLKVILSGNDNLDKIAECLSQDKYIIELDGHSVSDSYFLDFSKIVQLLSAQFESTFIVSGRADIALLSNADGVCLKEGNISVSQARNLLHDNAIVGVDNYFDSESDYILSDKRLKVNVKILNFVKTKQACCKNILIYEETH